jgi:hypothetical protein
MVYCLCCYHPYHSSCTVVAELHYYKEQYPWHLFKSPHQLLLQLYVIDHPPFFLAAPIIVPRRIIHQLPGITDAVLP